MRRGRTLFACAASAALVAVLCPQSANAVVMRAIKLIAGSGVSVSASDNATTGQQEWTVTNTSPSPAGALTPTSVSGSGWWYSSAGTLLSVAVEPGGDVSPGTESGGVLPLILDTVNSNVGTFGDSSHVAQVTLNGKGLVTAASNVAISFPGSSVTSVSGSSPISVSPTTGAAVVSLTTVPVTLGGTNATSLGAHNLLVGNGISTVQSGLAPSTAGNILQSNGTDWASVPTAGQLVGRAIIQTDLTFASCTINPWSHITSATVVANTVTQLVADSVTWTSQAVGSLAVVSTPTATAAPVFEISGTQSGDRINLRLETAGTDPGSHQLEGLVLAYAVSAGAPTWPGGYTFTNNTSMLGVIQGMLSVTSAYVSSAPSGGNVWVQPAIVNICAGTGQTTQLGGATNLIVEDWR